MQTLHDAGRVLSWHYYGRIPDLSGRVCIVTGGDAGIGLEMVRRLAEKHAYVIIATRSEERAREAIAHVRTLTPNGTLEFAHLDLASLSSVRDFAEAFRARGVPLHLLVANAGVAPPEGEEDTEATEDGLEIHMGTYFLGHFYLVHLLLDILKSSAPSRAVFVSSAEEARGFVPWDDVTGRRSAAAPAPRRRRPEWRGAAALCALMAARELHRRLHAAATGLSPLPDIFVAQPGAAGGWLRRLGGQGAWWGARGALYAATEPSLEGQGGGYIGPLSLGWPAALAISVCNTARQEPPRPEGRDPAAMSRVYDLGADALEELTGRKLPHRLPPATRAAREG